MDNVFAMPSLTDSTDFGLTSEAANRKMVQHLRKLKPTKVRDWKYGSIIETVGTEKGYYFIIDPDTDLLVYLVKFTRQNKKLIGGSNGAQTAVWRALDSDISEGGLAKTVFFDILLPRFGTMMSDSVQTERGRDFWISLLGHAIKRNKGNAYLIDYGFTKIMSIEMMAELRVWTTMVGSPWAWNSMKHKGIRFVISKSKLESNRLVEQIIERLPKD